MNWSLVMTMIWITELSASADPGLELAFKGGFDAAALSKGYRVSRYGLSGGLAGSLERPLAGQLSLAGQMDLLYTTRGGEVVVDGASQGKIQQHYVDIMIAARPEVRLGPSRSYILLGGGVNLLVGANDENAAGVPRDITHDLQGMDVTLLAGAGIALHLPGRGLGPFRLGSIFLEGRYDHGLIDIDTMNLGFKNRTWSVMLGLSFALASGAVDSPPMAPPARRDPLPPPAASSPM